MIELVSQLLEPSLLSLLYVCLAVNAGAALWSLLIKDWPWLYYVKASLLTLCVILPCYLIHITLELTDTSWPNFFGSAYLVISQSHLGQMWLLMCLAQGVALFVVFCSKLLGYYRQAFVLGSVYIFCMARAASGHAAEAGLLGGAVWIHAIHIFAACLWLGLIICYLGSRAYTKHDIVYATQQLSELASLCLMVMVLTGFADSLRIYQLADNFWQSDYFDILLIKLGVLLGALSLAAVNRFYTLPRLSHKTALFCWLVALESVFLWLILAIASYLGGTMP